MDAALVAVFLLGLGYIAWWDFHAFRIPDHATIPLALLGVVRLMLGDDIQTGVHLIAALLGAAVFLFLRYIYQRIRGREGLGLGDVKLVAVGGLWVGSQLALAVAIGAGLALAVRSLEIVLTRKTADEPIPLGVFLSLGLAATTVFRFA